MTLTKSDITDNIYNKTGLTKNKSTQLVDSLLEIITQTLANGEDILVSGFGKWCVKEKRKRRGRNLVYGLEIKN